MLYSLLLPFVILIFVANAASANLSNATLPAPKSMVPRCTVSTQKMEKMEDGGMPHPEYSLLSTVGRVSSSSGQRRYDSIGSGLSFAGWTLGEKPASYMIATSAMEGSPFASSTPASCYRPLSLLTSSLPAATAGSSYSAGLTANGGQPPYTWSLGPSSLQQGFSLSSNGNLFGISSIAGTYAFSIIVSDAFTNHVTDLPTLTVTLASTPTPVPTQTPNPTPTLRSYYVSNAGSDSNNGTSTGTPWQTIAHVNAQTFSPGDSILFNRGDTWREQLTIPSSGASGNPITISSYGTGAPPAINGSNLVASGSWTNTSGNVWQAAVTTQPNLVWFNGTPGIAVGSIAAITATYDWFWSTNVLYVYSTSNPGTAYTNPGIESGSSQNNDVVINGQSYITVDGLNLQKIDRTAFNSSIALVVNANNVTFQNCVIEEAYGRLVYAYSTTGLSNLTINNCVISGLRNTTAKSTIAFDGTGAAFSNCIVEHSVISQNSNAGPTGGDGIFFDGTTNCTAQYNDISGQSNSIYVKDGAAGTVIRYNVFHGSFMAVQDRAATVANTNTQVSYNIAYAMTGSPAFQSDGDVATNTGSVFYNNVYYEVDNGSDTVGFTFADANTGAAMENNIAYLVRPGSAAYVVSAGSTAGTTMDYNLWDNAAANGYVGNWGGTLYTNTQYGAGTKPAGQDAHTMISDPKFTNPSSNLFTLQSGSPAIGAGANLGSTYNQAILPGSTWPVGIVLATQGSKWNMGACVGQ